MKWLDQETLDDILWNIKHPIRATQHFLNYTLRLPSWLVYPISNFRDWKHIREFPPGTVIENCSYHPCIIIENDGGDITALSLITNSETCCSLFHCGVVKLTAHEVQARIKAYKDNGERGLMALVGWPEEEIENFMREWRSEPSALSRELPTVTDPNF